LSFLIFFKILICKTNYFFHAAKIFEIAFLGKDLQKSLNRFIFAKLPIGKLSFKKFV